MTNFILLITYNKLNDEQKEKWLNIVSKFIKNGSISNRKIMCQKTSKLYKHKIFLKSELSINDLEYIAAAWENFYKDDFDIEITINEDIKLENKEYIIDAELKENLISKLSKFLHNRWVDGKISEGWRYGLTYNLEEQTHPSLKNWDNLQNEYKKLVEINDEQLIKIIESHPTLFS
jgi:hypothetical protein